VQSGFEEAFVKFVGEAFFTHSAHIYADMHVFFATGVVARRAWLPWMSRIVRPGEDVAGTWLRGSDLGESTATL
jgi:hypothetical protein